VIGLLLGFTDFNALNGLPKWVGLKNFTTFFSSKDYLTLLGRQMWMGSLCLVANVVLSFMLALALNIKHPLRGFFRTSVYIPNIAAAAITSGVFIALLNPFNGGINMFFKSLGMDPIIWNYSQFWMVFWIIVFFVWRSAGPAAIIWLGGLQSIDPSLYEAAKVDGAGRFQQILYITIPGLRFIASYILLTGLIGVMQMFDVVMLISHGNPYGKTDVLMYRIYRDGVVSFNMGMAGAASTVLGLVTIVIAFLVFIVISKGDNNE
jgi:ABC-type sugar transport system permease subunit